MNSTTTENVFKDEDLQLELLAMAIWDQAWLNGAGDSVTPADFKLTPRKGSGGQDTSHFIVASVALEFFKKKRVPVDTLIGPQFVQWAKETSASKQRLDELAAFVKKLKARYNPDRSPVLLEAVVEFKNRIRRREVIRELVELDEAGQLNHENFQTLTSSVMLSTNGKPPGVLASEITAKPVEWLFKYRIPLGALTTVDGDPGIGKSALMLMIAAKVTKGKPLASNPLICSGGVVVLSAEDDPARTIQPRLKVADADLSRVRIVPHSANPGEEYIDTLPDHIPVLERAIASVNARLVIVDTLDNYLPPKIDSYKSKEVRRALAPLAAMAERLGVAVILIRHFMKATPSKPIHAGLGSIGVIAQARNGFVVAQDPHDPEICVMAHAKANLGPLTESLAYRKEAVPTNLGDIVRIKILGTSDHNAESLLRTGDAGKSAVERAEEYLLTALSSGPVLEAELEKAGFSKWALKQAKTRLGVISEKAEFKGGWLWELPDSLPGN